MTGGIIEVNEASGGTLDGMVYSSGGVYKTGNSVFIMDGGVISGNTGITGGGVYVGTGCTFNMTGGKLQNNSSADYAQEVFVDTGAYFTLGTNAEILNTNQVWLISGSTVSLNGELTYDLDVTPVVYD
jgi:hypothetical protein